MHLSPGSPVSATPSSCPIIMPERSTGCFASMEHTFSCTFLPLSLHSIPPCSPRGGAHRVTASRIPAPIPCAPPPGLPKPNRHMWTLVPRCFVRVRRDSILCYVRRVAAAPKGKSGCRQCLGRIWASPHEPNQSVWLSVSLSVRAPNRKPPASGRQKVMMHAQTSPLPGSSRAKLPACLSVKGKNNGGTANPSLPSRTGCGIPQSPAKFPRLNNVQA